MENPGIASSAKELDRYPIGFAVAPHQIEDALYSHFDIVGSSIAAELC